MPTQPSTLDTARGSSVTDPGTPPPTPNPAHDAGLLLLRLALGLTIAAHGAQKLFGWFDGNGLQGTGQFFTEVGYPSGETMALIAGLSETLGGIGLVLGLFTPLAGAAVLGTMLNAVAVDYSDGFIGGYEFALLIGLGAAALALTGPGRLAADQALPGLRNPRPALSVGAVVLGAVAAGIVLLIRN